MPFGAVPDVVQHLASHQCGVLSRRQLLGCGVSSSVVGRLRHEWRTLAPGVYQVGNLFGPPSFETRVWAGLLFGGDGARACGATAAMLQGLAAEDDFRPAGSTRELPVEILSRRQPAPVAGFTFIREQTSARLASTKQEPPCTRIEDTVLDLCSRADSYDELVAWLTRACQRRLTTAEHLHGRLLARTRLRHRASMLPVLADVGAGATTVLEHKALTDVIRRHGLPVPVLQARTGTGAVADAAFPDFGTLVEFDGYLGHSADGVFRDMDRDNAHVLEGWTTLRFGWADVVGDPCGVAAQIAAVLAGRGWGGRVTRCSRCGPGVCS